MLPQYKNVMRIALPLALGNLSIPLVGLADTAFLGHYSNTENLAAVALGGQIITLLFWSFGFLRMGTTSFSARLYGAKNYSLLIANLQRSCLLALVLGLIMLVATATFSPVIAAGLSDNDQLQSISSSYIHIRGLSAPALFLNLVFWGWLVGMQRSLSSLVLVVCVNLVNCALDYYFIQVRQLAADGAAYASVIAEYAGTLVAVCLVYRTLQDEGIKWHKTRLFTELKAYAELVSLNAYLFVRTLFLLLVFVFMNVQAGKLGTDILAANAILLNLIAFSAYFLDSFAHSTEALCGNSWSRKNKSEFIETIKACSYLATLFAIIWLVVTALASDSILSIYSSDPALLNIASDHMVWVILMPLISLWCYQLDGTAIAMGSGKAMMQSILISVFGVYIPAWYLATLFGYENAALWFAFACLNFARSLSLAPMLLRQATIHFANSKYT